MGNVANEHVSNRGLAVWSAVLGGGLLFINWIWQGYLGLTPGRAEIYQDTTHYAYYMNELMLFILLSPCYFSLQNHPFLFIHLIYIPWQMEYAT